MLRDWWKTSRPQVWLFPNRLSGFEHVTPRSLNRAFHVAARQAGITKPVCLHTLRHCFATHLLEQKVDVRAIQVLLGHKKLETTAVYTHVAAKTLDGIASPLDLLGLRPRRRNGWPGHCARLWRSPTSSALMDRRGDGPMPATSALAS